MDFFPLFLLHVVQNFARSTAFIKRVIRKLCKMTVRSSPFLNPNFTQCLSLAHFPSTFAPLPNKTHLRLPLCTPISPPNFSSFVSPLLLSLLSLPSIKVWPKLSLFVTPTLFGPLLLLPINICPFAPCPTPSPTKVYPFTHYSPPPHQTPEQPTPFVVIL